MSEDLQVVKTPEQLASEIKVIEAQTRKLVLMAAVEIGERLTQAKAALPVGCWISWLKENVAYSERKAQVLMNVYRTYGDNQGKLFGETISNEKLQKLGFSQAVALLAIKDEEERAEFVNNNAVEDMSVRELEQTIKEKNELKEAKERLEGELKKAKQAMTITENRIAELEGAMQDSEAEELKQELKRQKAAMQEAEERTANLQETIKLESQEKARLVVKVNELEKELAKPVETAVVYEVPEETKQELAELKAALEKAKAQPGSSEEKVRFVMYYEALNKAFEGMLQVVKGIEDEEKQAQYRSKLLNIVGVMKSKV